MFGRELNLGVLVGGLIKFISKKLVTYIIISDFGANKNIAQKISKT